MSIFYRQKGYHSILWVVGVLSIMFASCSNKEVVPVLNDANTSAAPTQEKYRLSTKEKKEIDWGAIAIKDAEGGGIGFALASRSMNLYVILASTAGVGVYASCLEYERQKEEIEKEESQVENLIYEPGAINPFLPFHPNPLTNSYSYSFPINYTSVGEAHNQVVQYECNIRAAEGDTDSESLFNDAMLQSGEIFDVSVSDCGIDYKDILLYEEAGWGMNGENIYRSYPDFRAIFFSNTAEYIYEYISNAIEQNIAEVESETMAMCIAFYSRCMWNTMAPDPAFTQECLAWSPYDNTLQYVVGRDNVANRIQNHEDGAILLYPAYGAEGLVALYLYGGYEDIPYVIVDNDLSLESHVFEGLSIQVPANEYEVEPTSCEGVYVINMQRYN